MKRVLGDPIIFLHIPKTGGTSLATSLKKCYGEPLKRRKKDSMEDYFKVVQNCQNVPKYIGGCHMPYGVHTYFQSTHYRYVTCLREPMERVLSNYHHFKSRGDKELNSRNLVDGLSCYFDFNNLQTRMLSGDLALYGVSAIENFNTNGPLLYSPSVLSKAKQNLLDITSKGGVVGVSHLSGEFASNIAKAFNIPRRCMLQSVHSKKNTSGKRKTKKLCSDEELEKIKELNQMDLELFEFAEKLAKKK